MKKILFFLGTLLLVSSVQADINTDSAVLRTMDKITGRVQKIKVNVGEQIQLGTMTVLLEKCLKKPPEETPENSAFLTIMDEENPEKPIFHGWMFSSNPALSAMEHPVYDIWVVSCGETQIKKEKRSSGDTQELPISADEPDDIIED